MEPKQYSLKPIETQLITIAIQQHAAMLSNLISFIAIERLAIEVSPQTRFELSDDAKAVTISEDQLKEDAGIVETPPSKGKK